MEDLKEIRKRIKYGRVLNRRLHTWNFRKLQSYIEYKAKLEGLPVEYVNPRRTSSLCPICGGKLIALNGYRLMKCICGYENDRDVVACLNMLRMRGLIRSPRKPSHEKRREGMKVNARPERKLLTATLSNTIIVNDLQFGCSNWF